MILPRLIVEAGMAKRDQSTSRRQEPGITGEDWAILVCSAALGGVLAGAAMTMILPDVLRHTRGPSSTKPPLVAGRLVSSQGLCRGCRPLPPETTSTP